MRCKNCGGRMYHYITDITGRRYYRCHQGLTTHDPLYPQQTDGIYLCGQVKDQDGKVVPLGTLLSYWSVDRKKVMTAKVGES